MENSSLNLAHLEARRAQRFKKSGRLEEALRCHSRAVELLNKATTLASSNLALDSLNWQQSHHHRESRLLQSKLAFLKRDEMATREVDNQTTNPLNTSLIAAIFRNLTQSSEALASYLRDFPETESEPRLKIVLDSHKAVDQHLRQLFPNVKLNSHDSSSETTPVDSQTLPPLDIPHFDFDALNDD